jgi:hypothetical protein
MTPGNVEGRELTELLTTLDAIERSHLHLSRGTRFHDPHRTHPLASGGILCDPQAAPTILRSHSTLLPRLIYLLQRAVKLAPLEASGIHQRPQAERRKVVVRSVPPGLKQQRYNKLGV